ncbi:MAG: MFS transporter [Clostridia bacterium]|nr:MFS transporter [Clostridia bacterium]
MNYSRVKYACYVTNISQALVCNLSPILFITFHNLYNISYSLLGLLVLIGFFTQLTIDLIFSFFSDKFNIPLSVKLTPMLTFVGLVVYAVFPYLFADHVYLGLVIGTVIFSASGGLAEVLISPTIAAIPSDNPDREMSKLHSIYAWGVVLVVVLGTLFLLWRGSSSWQIMSLLFALVPLFACFLFLGTKIPVLEDEEKEAVSPLSLVKDKGLWLCVLAIFLGGASECTMAQWCSGYLEQAVGIPKVLGDIFGVALFGFMLGLGRTLYAKIGKNIGRVLFFGAVGAALCYLLAAISPFPVLGLFACAFTGFCVSMLWPGSLIVGSDRFPQGGVFIFAMMAAGGDLGASVGPQIIGIVTDSVAAAPWAAELAASLSLAPEQLGMKIGMLIGMLFPLLAIFIYLRIWRGSRKKQSE